MVAVTEVAAALGPLKAGPANGRDMCRACGRHSVVWGLARGGDGYLCRRCWEVAYGPTPDGRERRTA